MQSSYDSALAQSDKQQDIHQIHYQDQVQIEKSIRKKSPLGIESFLMGMEFRISSRKLSNTKNFQKFENTIISIADVQDAKKISELYDTVYRGKYPYAEMLDEKYITEFIENEENGRIYTYKSAMDGNAIGASGIFCVDKETKTGYLRGLLMNPAYSKKIDIIKSVCLSTGECCKFYRENLHKIYTETRTAHNKAQFIMELLGCRPCALFPNKDIFTGGNKRETDCLDVLYSNKALYELRNNYPVILPKFSKLFELMASRYELPPAFIRDSHFKNQFAKSKKFENRVFSLFQQLKVNKTEQKWNVAKYSIKKEEKQDTSTSNEPEISFIVTETVKSAEKVEIKYNHYHELAALLIKLVLTMKKDNIEYCEVYLPAGDPEEQQIFLETGFSVFGYAPAWKENRCGTLDDCIIFGRSEKLFNPDCLKLTPFGKELLNVLNPLIRII